MVRLDRVDDAGRLLVFTGQVDADLHMAALDLMVDRFADVMQQAGAARGYGVDAQFAGHHAGDVRDLNRMLQHVLAVAGAVAQAAERFDQLGMDAVDTGFKGGAFALGFDDLLHLTAGFFHHFLDACRMDASIHDQLFQAQARDLAAHRVERGKRNGLRRVVDDQVHAGQCFERADITALAADDAALHLVVGQRDDRYGRFGNMIGRAALDGGGNDLARGLFAFVPDALVDLAQLNRRVVRGLSLDRLDQHLARLVAGHAGDLLQLFELLGLDTGQVVLFLLGCLQLAGKVFVFALERIAFLVQRLLALDQAALELLGLVAALLELAVGFGALLVDLVLGFENRFPLFGFAGLDGLVDDARRFGLGGADLFFRNTLAVQKANDNAHNETHDTGHERYDDVVHCFGVSSY